jgi:uncharacterized integral membrane protein
MRRYLILAVCLLLLVLPVVLFVAQNQHHAVPLGLNLGVWAGVTPGPLPVAHLLVWASLGGLVVGLFAGFFRSSALKRRVRQLEAELTLQAVPGRD